MGINEALDSLYICATNAKSETLEEGYYEKCYYRVIDELEQKDKIIDLMAEQLAGIAIWDIKKDEPLILMSKEEVIKYYERESKNAKD